MYRYAATVVRVIDGDTVELDVDLGFRVRHRCIFRVYGVDAPERRGDTREAGDRAREWLSSTLAAHELRIETFKPDKYGRWLFDAEVDGLRLSSWMIAAGHAVPWK